MDAKSCPARSAADGRQASAGNTPLCYQQSACQDAPLLLPYMPPRIIHTQQPATQHTLLPHTLLPHPAVIVSHATQPSNSTNTMTRSPPHSKHCCSSLAVDPQEESSTNQDCQGHRQTPLQQRQHRQKHTPTAARGRLRLVI